MVTIGTQDSELIFINEAFRVDSVSQDQLDLLLERGWRHFGTNFFRYSVNVYRDEIRRVLPLRIRLSKFKLSKSQRRCLKRNADLRVEIRETKVTDQAKRLFHRHKRRFESGPPSTIYAFLSRSPATVPCIGHEVACYNSRDELIAVSYFDIGAATISGVYAMFEPEESARGLGTFTMLKEIQYAIDSQCEFYYQGYAYEGPSFYDYKLRYSGIERFDWQGHWVPHES
jgi:leucyl-tRNA---protein transferase